MLKSHKSHTKKHSPLICHVSIRCQQGCLHTNGLCLCVEKLLCRLRCRSRRCSWGGSSSSPFIESRSTECLESRGSLQAVSEKAMEEHLWGLGLGKAGERTQGSLGEFAVWLTGKGHFLLPGRFVSEGPSSSILTDPPVSSPGSEAGDWEAPGPHPVREGHHASEQK